MQMIEGRTINLLICIDVVNLESNHAPKFCTVHTTAISADPTVILPIFTFTSYCLVPRFFVIQLQLMMSPKKTFIDFTASVAFVAESELNNL